MTPRSMEYLRGGKACFTVHGVATGSSDRLQQAVRLWRQRDCDCIAGTDNATSDHNGHDAGLADELTLVVTSQSRRHEPRLKAIKLCARVTEAGDLDDGFRAKLETSTGWKIEEGDAAGRDVLAHQAGEYRKSAGNQLFVQLGVDEVDLTEVRLVRVTSDTRAVLHGRSRVSVTLNAEIGHKTDHWLRPLGHCVSRAAAHSSDISAHVSFLPT